MGALLQPFDVVRTRMQLSGEALSPLAAVREATRSEGLAGLWKGTVPSVARLTLGAGLQFFCIDALRAAWPEPQEVEAKALVVSDPSRAESGRSPTGVSPLDGGARASADETAPEALSSPSVERAAVSASFSAQSTSPSSHASPSAPASPAPSTSLSSLRVRRAVRNFAIGGMARAIAASAACPLSVVKTRVEASGRSVAVGGALLGILRAEGPRGLFAGLGPTLASTAPFSALYYALYAPLAPALRATLAGERTAGKRAEDGPGGDRAASAPTSPFSLLPYASPASAAAIANFAAGAVAASVATVLTHPADVLRTHAQLAGTHAKVGGPLAAPARRPSSTAIARRLTAERGLKWTMAGVAPRVAKRAVQTGLLWALYEELLPRVKRALGTEEASTPKKA